MSVFFPSLFLLPSFYLLAPAGAKGWEADTLQDRWSLSLSLLILMLQLLDIFLTIVHLVLIGFNLFGWIWPATRKLHLVTILATGASWFILGIWFGLGYCPITDWQWEVKKQLGEQNLPGSFIKYFADKITGKNFSSSLINYITLGFFLAATVLSVYFNFIRQRFFLNKVS